MVKALRVLILGGTTEASALARRLAGDARFEAIFSLAGRTSAPKSQPIATRTGGFGGVDGLTRFVGEHTIDAVIDATHPYADQMSSNAVLACACTGTPLASLVRPPWDLQAGDRWQIVPSTTAAAFALGPTPCRVFLSLGRQELHAFAAAPQHHYLARVIETPDPRGLPPDLRLLRARGPFDRAAEERLLTGEKIEVLVSKNAGGMATYAKMEAARALGLPAIMIDRPHKPAGHVVGDAGEAIAWLEQHLHAATSRSLRGV